MRKQIEELLKAKLQVIELQRKQVLVKVLLVI